MMPLVEDLSRLQELRASGALSDEQFEQAKATLLNPPPPTAPTFVANQVAAAQKAAGAAFSPFFRNFGIRPLITASGVGVVSSIAAWLPFLGATVSEGKSSHAALARVSIGVTATSVVIACMAVTAMVAWTATKRGREDTTLRRAGIAAAIALFLGMLAAASYFLDKRDLRMLEHSGLATALGLPFCVALASGIGIALAPVENRSSALARTLPVSLAMWLLLTAQTLYFDFVVFANARFFENKVRIVMRALEGSPEVIWAFVGNLGTMLVLPAVLLWNARAATAHVARVTAQPHSEIAEEAV